MKNSILITMLFVMFSLISKGQEVEDDQQLDSSVYYRNNVIFDRVVQHKLMEFPFKRIYSNTNNGIIGMMMLLSEDGYFGFSHSNFLKITNRYYNVMGLRDLEGNEAEIEIESDGTSYFRDSDGNTMSSFKESLNQMVIRDEAGEVYYLTFDWLSNLTELNTKSGYQLTIGKIKSGFEIKDNQNNVAEIKKQKNYVWVATYSNGKVISTKRGIWNSNSSIIEDGNSTFNIDYDIYTNNYKIKNNQGLNLVISNQFDPNFGKDLHHHDHAKDK